jgi:DNA-binding MurR/RpiR family transcriptional regulator
VLLIDAHLILSVSFVPRCGAGVRSMDLQPRAKPQEGRDEVATDGTRIRVRENQHSYESLANLVHRRMGQLTAAERKVARVFLTAYPIAGLETVAQLAQRAKVSGPTVTRFVTKLGFDGYPEFQDALHSEVQEKLTSSLAQYSDKQVPPAEGFMAGGLRVFREELDKSFAQTAPSAVDAVVNLLARPRYDIMVTGGRYSQVLAFHLFLHLNLMRPKCRYVGYSPTSRWDELINAGNRTVLVIFDYRRYQNSTIEFARRAAERGCHIVLFTDPWLSPVAEVARHVLTSTVRAPSPFDSVVPAFALVETVVAGLSLRIGAKAKPRIAELERLRAGATWGEAGLADRLGDDL